MKCIRSILALILSLSLALALTLPALAAADGGYDAFPTDLDAFWADYWASEYYTIDEYMEEFGYTDREELMEALYDVWLKNEAYDAWKESFLAEHADEVAAFDSETYWREEYYYYDDYYDSVEAFLADYEMTREEFDQWMLNDWLSDQWQAYQEELQRNETIKNLGGVPGELGVMLNGSYLSFTDAKPEAVAGRIMVPLRALMESLGVQPTFSKGAVTCKLDDATLTFTVGGDTVTAVVGGQTETITMDCASYARDGRTYVPVRFFAQALGYEVLWDKEYQTAVLVDPAAVVETIDTQFSIVNRLLSNLATTTQRGKNYRTSGSLDLNLTALDSLNGNTSYSGALGLDALHNDDAASGSVTLTLGDTLLELIMQNSYLDPIETAALKAALKKVELSFIASTQADRYWLQIPILGTLSEGVYDGSTWYSGALDLDSLLPDDYEAAAPTVGQLIYANTPAYRYEQSSWASPVLRWSDLMNDASTTALVLGDDSFTSSGGKDVLTYTLADYEEDFGIYYSSDYKELTLTLTVDQKGKANFSLTLQTDPAYLYSNNYRMTLAGSLSSTGVTADLDLHLANQLKLKLKLNLSQTETSQKPQTAPPAGADVVDLDGLGGYGYDGESSTPATEDIPA